MNHFPAATLRSLGTRGRNSHPAMKLPVFLPTALMIIACYACRTVHFLRSHFGTPRDMIDAAQWSCNQLLVL